ncbi:MAG: carboxypeptidase-like regulatory domain-containing protein, partial [Bacteroidota bacterium]
MTLKLRNIARASVLLWIPILLLSSSAYAQDANVQGVVVDTEGESLPGVNITVVGTDRGTVTQADGSFALYVPFDELESPRLRFSFIGFGPVEESLSGPVENMEIVMREAVERGEEVIVSASRVDERIMEVPVTVGRLSGSDLAARPSIDLVASMKSMPGVDVSRSSMLVNSPSTRGFNSTKSERVIQLTDYVDFVAPSLSVYSGNTSGPPLVDMESTELVHGASSALYGPNAFNGVIIMNSRDPINDQGIDLQVKGGTRDMIDVSGRVAEGFFDDRVAIKLVGRYMEANEFISSNLDAQPQSVTPRNNAPGDPRGYDPVNRYGALNLSGIDDAAAFLESSGIDPTSNNIFLPGYSEEALVGSDMNASTWQISPTVSARLGDDIRATYWYRFSSSEGIYQSNSRFRWDGITVSTNALELEGNNWLVRGYRTADNSGDSFDINLLGAVMN